MINSYRISFLLSLLLIYSVVANSQIKKSGIGINFGAAHYRIIDQGLTFNKLLFRGILPTVHLDYTKETSKGIFSTSLGACSGKIKMKDGKSDPADFTNARLSVSFVKKITTYKMFGWESTLYAGLQLGSLINYIKSEDLDNETVLVSHGLYINAFQDIPLDESKSIRLSIVLPVAAFMKRIIADGGLNIPPTDEFSRPLNLLFSDTKFSFPGIARFGIDYLKELSARTDFTIKYGFTYINTSVNEPIRYYSNEILLGFKFYFRHEK